MINIACKSIVPILLLLFTGCSDAPVKQTENPANQTTMGQQTAISSDGTVIAYDTIGNGPYIIVVNGALSYRKSEGIHELTSALATHFTVISYDRRGRGESGDTKPYAVAREIEDIAAIIDKAGGSAYLYGSSSGAALSLITASALGPDKVKKLAMYEPPYGAVSEAAYKEEEQKINELVSAGKPGDAVLLFMQYRGTPPDKMVEMKQSPAWSDFERLGPTLVYDFEVMGDGNIPMDKAKKLSIPCLVMTGEKSPEFMRTTGDNLETIIPGARHKTLTGQTHQASADAVVPVLVEFFGK